MWKNNRRDFQTLFGATFFRNSIFENVQQFKEMIGGMTKSIKIKFIIDLVDENGVLWCHLYILNILKTARLARIVVAFTSRN